jgi:hypothetical protein
LLSLHPARAGRHDPKQQPPGRREGTSQWTMAAAARLDRIADAFQRQVEAAAADEGAQKIHDTPERGAAGARAAGARRQGGPSGSQHASRSGGASSSSSRPPPGTEPTAIPGGGDTRRPSEVIGTATGRWAGAQPRDLPADPAEELAALRLAGSRPQSFAPWQHAVMVCGRPVVVPLFVFIR